ncbi:hypothetical protein SISSUDRAFT_1056081 [Sistotremastrum suecicum HHB10207 ss-3]|uniref:Alpha-type protein kinase domain-containing protein n=1 Tax=Sistotremastrum suecicum HHB10207 ss-3 TaxID=1314776 RepID=A0A165XAA6_9AGAM|nr:hypothetical protein SISSUDRAFT_1056081 [Sistotremastrum suecicum HHB10207 ss-3]
MQYKLSAGRCVVADYQGDNRFLTDAELATKESNSRHFGRGSISDVLTQFEEKHVCNAWCDYFGIGQNGQTMKTAWKPLRALGIKPVCDPAYTPDSDEKPEGIPLFDEAQGNLAGHISTLQ